MAESMKIVKGQTVFIEDIRRDVLFEAEVRSSGIKYVSVKGYGRIIKFDVRDGYRQVSDYSPAYRLYTCKEDYDNKVYRRNLENTVKVLLQDVHYRISKMNNQTLIDLIKVLGGDIV